MALSGGTSMSEVIDLALDRLIKSEQLRHDVGAYTRQPLSDDELAVADLPVTLDLADAGVDYEALYGAKGDPTRPTPRRRLVRRSARRQAGVRCSSTREPMGRLLHSVICAPISSTIRGLSTEVAVGTEAGLVAASVANFDNTLLLDRTRLIRRLGRA